MVKKRLPAATDKRQQKTNENAPSVSVLDQVKAQLDGGGAVEQEIVDQAPPLKTTDDQPEDVTEAQPEPEPIVISEVTLAVPVADQDRMAFRLHLDISISGDDAKALRRIAVGLSETGERVNGHRCEGTNDAVRWMLHKLADQMKPVEVA